jgi:hypothetical protein
MFECASSWSRPIPSEQLRRPSRSVTILFTLEAALVVIFALSQHEWSRLDFSAMIIASALTIITIRDGQSYATLCVCCQHLIQWTLIKRIFESVCTLQTLVQSFVDLHGNLTAFRPTGGSFTLPIISYVYRFRNHLLSRSELLTSLYLNQFGFVQTCFIFSSYPQWRCSWSDHPPWWCTCRYT